MPMRNAWTLFAALLMSAPVFGADAAPASKQAYMALPTIYVSFELTQAGAKDYSAPKDSLTDGAYRVNKHFRFEMPMNMQLPGSCPTNMPTEEQMEEGRCMGWTAMPPDDSNAIEALTTGKVDMAKNPMFVPAEYSVDDVTHSRFRDSPTDGFGTQTTTYQGKGATYVARSGMVLCDFKKLTCQVANVPLSASMGDEVTITSTSDVPGSETQVRKQDPQEFLPQPPAESANKMASLPLALSGPSATTFSVPGKFNNGAGPEIVVKVTISPKAAAKTGAASK